MYFLLESLLLSPALGTTSFRLLSQHACSARENNRRDEECSKFNHYPLPRWRHRMCRGKRKAQIGLRSTKGSFSTVGLRLFSFLLGKKTNVLIDPVTNGALNPAVLLQFHSLVTWTKCTKFLSEVHGFNKNSSWDTLLQCHFSLKCMWRCLGMTVETFIIFPSEMNEV